MRAFLVEHAMRIKYFCLHGFVAVDGVEFIIRRMRELASEARCFILDMHQAAGISESAARLLNQARLGFADEGIAVVFSRMHGRSALLDPLGKAARGGDRGLLSFEDNDLAVEWCENRLYGEHSSLPEAHAELADSALFSGMPVDLMDRVVALAHSQSFGQGDTILVSGQADDGRVFFIESGRVSILVPLSQGGHQRIASLGPGMNFGEMSLLDQASRSASVHADTDVVCRVLDTHELDALESEVPQLKIVLLENLARDLAEKLRRATQWISALA